MKDEILLELRSQFDANVKIVTVQDEDFQNVINANAMQKRINLASECDDQIIRSRD